MYFDKDIWMKKGISIALLSGLLVCNEKIIYSQETLSPQLYFSNGKETLSSMQKALATKIERFSESMEDSVHLFVNQKATIHTKEGLDFHVNLSGLTLQDGDILSTDNDGLCKLETQGAIIWLAENSSLQMNCKKNRLTFVLLRGVFKIATKDYSGNHEITAETTDIFTTNQINDLVMSYAPNKGTSFYSLAKPNQIFLKADLTKSFAVKNKEGLFAFRQEAKKKHFDNFIAKQITQLFREEEEIKYLIASDYLPDIGNHLSQLKFSPLNDFEKNKLKILDSLQSSSLKDSFDQAELIFLTKSYLEQILTIKNRKTEKTVSNSKIQKPIEKSEAKQEAEDVSGTKASRNEELYIEKLKQAELLRLEEARLRRDALEAELKAKSLK